MWMPGAGRIGVALRSDRLYSLEKPSPVTAKSITNDGLTDADARRRLNEHGPNELPVSKPRGVLRLLARSGHRAHVPAAGGLRRHLHGAGRSPRGLDAAGLRLRRDGHHLRPAAPHRTIAGGLARPVEPARTGHARRAAATHRRARTGVRRHRAAGRRRPRPGRHAARRVLESRGRRVAADRRVSAGGQASRTACRGRAVPGASEADPRVSSGTLVTQGTAPRRVIGHRRAQRAGPHRPVASQASRRRARRSSRRRGASCKRVAVVGLALACACLPRRYGVVLWRLAARPAGRAHAGHGHPAGGIARGADASSWDWAPGGWRARRCWRAASRPSNCWVRPPCCASTRPARSPPTAWRSGDCGTESASYDTPASPVPGAVAGGTARRARVRGAGQSSARLRPDGDGHRRRRAAPAGRHRASARRLDAGRRLSAVARDAGHVTRLAVTGPARAHDCRQRCARGHRRSVPSRRRAQRTDRRAGDGDGGRRACACSASPGPRFDADGAARATSTTSSSSSWVWSRWKIRCAQTCRRRLPSAMPPASAW